MSELAGFFPQDLDPQAWAFVCADQELNWAQVSEQVTRLGNALLELAGDGRVGVIGDNTPYTIMCHLACMANGISSVGINPKLRADEFAHILQDAQCTVAIAAPIAAEQASIAAQRLGITLISWPDHFDYGAIEWNALLASAANTWMGADRAPKRPVLYTSGTSGFPRGTEVQWTVDIGETVNEYLTLLRENVKSVPFGPHIVVGPLYHNGPLLSVRSMFDGRPNVIQTKFDAQDMLRLIDERKVVASVLVPTHLNRLLNLDDEIKAQYDVSSVERFSLTGAACPVATKQAFIEWFGPVLLEAYGGTESNTVCSITSAEAALKPGSVGKPLDRFIVHVVDEEGNEVPTGVSGRLFFIDTLGRGITFLNDPEKTAAAHLRPGVFTVGDIGYVDEDGYVYINDRSVDMVISGGVNIYPAECERVLQSHPSVLDVAAVGLPDADMGERMVAVVELDPSAPQVDATDLDAFCRASLAPYKCPKEYQFFASTGRNVMGKVNKRALREALLAPDPQAILLASAGR